MSILSDTPSNELQDLWVEAYSKISKQYDTRRVVVDYAINFNDGTKKIEKFDVIVASSGKWNKSVDSLTNLCIENILFSAQVFTAYYGKTIEKIVIQ